MRKEATQPATVPRHPNPQRVGAARPAVSDVDAVAAEVRQGLTRTPKQLRPWLFYDAQGSALFEQITNLPEYYPTRTERSILQHHADEMIRAAGAGPVMIELGAGTATKTTVLLKAFLEQQGGATFHPIDISPTALEVARRRLREELPALRVHPVADNNLDGLAQLRHVQGRKLVIYLGSSIGNDEPLRAAQWLGDVRSLLRAGDALLIGMDMVKEPAVLVAAYDDATGVTARFNLNVLNRLNRELDADFNLEAFQHLALWNAALSRIEMHLVSRAAQHVHLGALDLTIHLDDGERIHTENSYKFTMPMVQQVLQTAGFALEQSWFDSQRWFGLHLARVL